MEEIRKEISDWLLAQPDWLQEAAERLLRQGDLGAADLFDLCSMIKTPEGRMTTNHRTFGGLLNTPEIKGEMHISSLGEIGGIENLAPKEPLLLGKGNLVVIYGHNGSGKSGYTRILKKASGKPRATRSSPTSRPTSCAARPTVCARRSIRWAPSSDRSLPSPSWPGLPVTFGWCSGSP